MDLIWILDIGMSMLILPWRLYRATGSRHVESKKKIPGGGTDASCGLGLATYGRGFRPCVLRRYIAILIAWYQLSSFHVFR